MATTSHPSATQIPCNVVVKWHASNVFLISLSVPSLEKIHLYQTCIDDLVQGPSKMSTKAPAKKPVPAKVTPQRVPAKKPVPQPVKPTNKPAARTPAKAPAARTPATKAPAAKAPAAKAPAARAPARPAAPKQEPARAGNWINRTVQGGVASVGNYAGALVGGVGNSVNGIGTGIGNR